MLYKNGPAPHSTFSPSKSLDLISLVWPYPFRPRHRRAVNSHVSFYAPYISRLVYNLMFGECPCTLPSSRIATLMTTLVTIGAESVDSWAFFWFITYGVLTGSSACGEQASFPFIYHLNLIPSLSAGTTARKGPSSV